MPLIMIKFLSARSPLFFVNNKNEMSMRRSISLENGIRAQKALTKQMFRSWSIIDDVIKMNWVKENTDNCVVSIIIY